MSWFKRIGSAIGTREAKDRGPGAILKETREGKGLSIDEVSKRTRIRKPIILSIEQEEYQLLPAPIFVRGLVAMIARELGLEVKEVSKSYFCRHSERLDELESKR
jgi:cytoskeletal protein RodZ